MIFTNAQERYKEAKRSQILIKQVEEKVLAEFWQSELGEFLINEIEEDITLESAQGLFEAQINFYSIWNNLNATFPIRTLPSYKSIIYDVVAMYKDKGFEVEVLNTLMPRLMIKWDNTD